jgi:parallel beta-helix repeat protein
MNREERLFTEGHKEMKLKAVSGIMLTLLLIGMLILTFNIQPVRASGTIYIRADGSVEGTTHISSVDNVTYTFTDNIYDEIVAERDNIVVDGVGYTVQGTGSGTGIYLSHRSNVTIKNIEIESFYYGIGLDLSSNNNIYENNITKNYYGIGVDSSSNNLIHHNTFMNNTYPAFPIGSSYNVWDDGYPSGGNYWSHYVDVDHYSGPYQNETGSDGIWDHPYVIDENNQDTYPLTRPYGREPEFNFIAYGDTRGEQLPWDAVSPLHEEIVSEYLQHDPDFIIHTGDMVSAGGLWYQWVEFNESIAAVQEAGIPFYGVVGNHEKYTDQEYVYDEEFINYRTYFDFTHVIDEPGENELYYSFDYEGVHFVFLNTEDYFDDREDGSNELTVLPLRWTG